jgi:hypothetical protein
MTRRQKKIKEYFESLKERRYSEEITIDEQKIKELLVAIREPRCPFEVSIIKEMSFKCSGNYSYNNERITLYLLNHNNNKEIINTAIHEYAHHFMGRGMGHRTEFWDCYYQLLEIADRKGFYSGDIYKSNELQKITAIINRNDLLKHGRKFKKEFGERLNFVFAIISELCDEIGIDYRYYLVKYLGIDWYKKSRRSYFRSFYSLDFTCNGVKRYVYSISKDDFLKKFFNHYSTS